MPPLLPLVAYRNGTMLPMLNDIYHMLDPVALTIGGFEIRWYGLAYILGFVCSGIIAYRTAKRWKIAFDPYDVLVFVCYCAFGIIIGARVGYCLIYGDGYYLSNPLEILAINKGGMSFHGGLVGIMLGGALYAAVYKMPYLTLADLVSCSVPIGLFFGRCANFINGELYGAPTDLPWGVDFLGTGVMYHPSQLYEALLEGIVLLVILQMVARRKNTLPRGCHLALFLMIYGVFRFFLEFIRLPDAQMGYYLGTWGTMGQFLCCLMVIGGIILLVVSLKRNKPQAGRKIH